MTKRGLEKQVIATDTLQLDYTHQITLLKQEKASLLDQHESIDGICNKTKLDYKRLEEKVHSLHNELTKCQRERGTVEAQLVTVRVELSTSQGYCTQLKKEMK